MKETLRMEMWTAYPLTASIALASFSDLTTALKLKKMAMSPLHWLLPFFFEWGQGTTQHRAPLQQEHKPSGSCQLLVATTRAEYARQNINY